MISVLRKTHQRLILVRLLKLGLRYCGIMLGHIHLLKKKVVNKLMCMSFLSFVTVATTMSTYLFHVLIHLLLVTDLFSTCMTASARKLVKRRFHRCL